MSSGTEDEFHKLAIYEKADICNMQQALGIQRHERKLVSLDESVQVSRSIADNFSINNITSVKLQSSPSRVRAQPNLKSKQPNFGYHTHCMADYTERSLSVPLLKQKSIASERCDSAGSLWKKCLGTNNVSVQRSQSTLVHSQSSFPQSQIKRSCKKMDKYLPRRESQRSDSSMKNRLREEESFIEYARMLKRLSQVVPHRIDQPYYMSGSMVGLQERYQVDQNRLKQVQVLFKQHAARPHSRRFIAKYGMGIETSEEEAETRPTSSRKGRRDKRNNSRASSSKDTSLSRPSTSGTEEINRAMKRGGSQSSSERFTPSPPRRPLISVKSSKSSEGRTFITSYESNDEDETGTQKKFIDKEQKKAFSTIFEEIDYDGNGKLTFDELMERMFNHVSKKDVKHLMKIFDLNSDKTIDKREFVAVCALNDRLNGTRTDSSNTALAIDLKKLAAHISLYKEMFDLIDQNGNGRIHLDEIMFLVSASSGKEAGTNIEVGNEIIRNVDKDANGYIDMVSFINSIPFFIKLHSKMLDTRVISLGELEKTRIAIGKLFGNSESTPL